MIRIFQTFYKKILFQFKLLIEKISKKAKEKTGSKNSNAKKFILISPNNKRFELNGNVKEFCVENGLSYSR
jgi:hypothetical protein